MHASDPVAVIHPASSLTSAQFGDDTDPLIRAIGRTPLISLRRLVASSGGRFELFAKAEFLNPTGSVKDRAAWAMIEDGFRSGRLSPGRILLDASSGNTAVAYAVFGARLGIPVELVLPQNASPDRVARIRSLGASVSFTDAGEGTDGAQREARRRFEQKPDRYFFPDQYRNPENPGAHFRTTGPEIWEALGRRLTHFVAGVGTGGTVTGTGRYLHLRNPEIRVVGVEPTGPLHGLEGLKHLPTALRPSTYDESVVDETVRVETEDAVRLCDRLAREEGLVVGTSSGAAVAASLALGVEHPGAVLVTILPDRGHSVGPGASR